MTMPEHHHPTVAKERMSPTALHTPEPHRQRGVLATTWNALTALVGGIMGLLPHLLHHVGLLGGVVLVTGATGNLAFAVLGLVFSLPLLRRLYRRFGSWKAPALALGVFALMFSLSAFVIGPAISNDDRSPGQDRTPVQTPDQNDHEGHHGG
jgi:hypothetical protein